MLYFIIKLVSFLGIQTFFNRISAQHLDHIPKEGPVIFACNHPNTMMDPLIVAHTCGRKLHFFAKATLFKHTVSRWFLKHLQLVPLYRKQDNPTETIKNIDSFSRGYDILKNRGAFLIFPEGISTGDRALNKIKTGAARIGFGAEKSSDWTLNAAIVPVGLSYSNVIKFRSDVMVRYGKPIFMIGYKTEYEADEFEAVHQLTEQIETALSKLTTTLNDLAVEEIVTALELIYKKELMLDLKMDIKSKSDEFSVTKGLVYAVEWYFENRPDKVKIFQKMLRQYQHHLDRLKLKDAYLDPASESASTATRIKEVLFIVLGFPIFVYGVVNNIVPYKFPRWFAKNFAKAKAQIAPTKLLAGTGIFIIYYSLEIFVVAFLTKNIFWTIIYSLSLIPSGNFVLDYVRRAKAYRQHLRFLSIFYRKRNLMYSLIKERQGLVEYLNNAKIQYMKMYPEFNQKVDSE